VSALLLVPKDGRARAGETDPTTPELQQQAQSTEDLAWLIPANMTSEFSAVPRDRSELLRERASRSWAGDHVAVARLNAVLATEGFRRSRQVLDRWIPRFDPGTDLIPTSVEPDGHIWAYGDTGSDLYPFLTIAAHLLAPEYDSLFLRVLAAERKLTPDVPDDVRVPGGQPLGLDEDDRIFGNAEYAKDGLLPMMDRLGPDPWLGRLVEVTDRIMAAASTKTRHHGLIPADSTEVNGDMLQVLSRVYWATGDPKYLEEAGRISRAYTEETFPTTLYLPPNRWDFVEKEPLDRRRFRLSDHGNEVLPGLLEWHFAATMAGDPEAATDRIAIRKMLDRLAEKGRSPDGLWMRVMEIPSGKVEQDGFTDNWGYVSQAFLIQSLIESVAPDGDPAAAARYRNVAAQSLAAVTSYRNYPWQSGEMDGYADTIESAIYMLNVINNPAAERWVDDQIGTLYGFQQPDGAVVERDLDGNFIRSTLLNAYRLTGGARVAPWSPTVMLGGVEEGSCLVLWTSSEDDWQGSLIIDRPRHRDYLNMPYDYARLNKWPEWFTADAGLSYRVEDSASGAETLSGSTLIDGLPITLTAGQARTFRVCPQ
ncbi:MAG: hypothetical protein AB7K36_24300, partial [Chloroflexota bacterium]